VTPEGGLIRRDGAGCGDRVGRRAVLRPRPVTSEARRDRLRVLLFSGTVVGILLLVAATVVVFVVFLDRFGTA
jgi:hypothetical protein